MSLFTKTGLMLSLLALDLSCYAKESNTASEESKVKSTEKKEYLERIKKVMQEAKVKKTPKVVLMAGGASIGGGNSGDDTLEEWAVGDSSVLESYRQKARVQVIRLSNYQRANALLLTGLIEHGRSSETQVEASYGVKAAVRGAEFFQALMSKTSTIDKEKMEIIYKSMLGYYDFILEKVQRLDITLTGPRPDDRDSIYQMERNFVSYVREQLEWLISNYIYPVTGIGVACRGENDFYFYAVEKFGQEMALDIKQSQWKYRLASEGLMLKGLSQTVGKYRQGDTSDYVDDPIAINLSFNELERILKELKRVR